MKIDEKYIKAQLISRRITPSDEAWGRLESRLGKNEKKPRGIYWMGIAASFLLGIVAASIYFSHSSSKKELAKTNIPVKNSEQKNTTFIAAVKTEKAKPIIKITPNPVKSENKNSISLKRPKQENNSIKKLQPGPNQRVNNIAAITNKDINQMLVKAQKRIKSAEIYKPDNKVSAMALLNNVENGIQPQNKKSLKDQAIKFAQNNWKKAKGLLAFK